MRISLSVQSNASQRQPSELQSSCTSRVNSLVFKVSRNNLADRGHGTFLCNQPAYVTQNKAIVDIRLRPRCCTLVSEYRPTPYWRRLCLADYGQTISFHLLKRTRADWPFTMQVQQNKIKVMWYDIINKTRSRPTEHIALLSEEDRATATGNTCRKFCAV